MHPDIIAYSRTYTMYKVGLFLCADVIIVKEEQKKPVSTLCTVNVPCADNGEKKWYMPTSLQMIRVNRSLEVVFDEHCV